MPDAEAPIEHEQDAEHPTEQHDRADHLRHHLGQEVGDVRDVPVDALDQLTRRVPAVELVIEPEHVPRDVEAQAVRDPPRRPGGRADDDHAEDLGDDRDA